MPKLPGYESQQTLGGVSQETPELTPQTNQALINIGRGITQFGQQITQKLNQAEVQKQYLEGKSAATSELNAYIRSLADREDYTKFEDDFKEAARGIKEKYLDIIDKPESKTAFEEWYGLHSEGLLMDVWDTARQKQAFAIQTSAETMYKQAIANNNPTGVSEAINFGRDNLIWTEGQAQELSANAEKEIKYNITRQTAIDLLHSEEGVTVQSEKQAIEFVYNRKATEGLDDNQRNQLIQDIKYEAANYHAMKEAAKKEEIENATNEILKITNTGVIPSREQIMQMSSDREWQAKWIQNVENEVARRDEEGDKNDLSRAYWGNTLTLEAIENARVNAETKDDYRKRYADMKKDEDDERKALADADMDAAQLELENKIVDAFFAGRLTHADMLPGGRFERIRDYKDRAEHWRSKLDERLRREKEEREKKEKSAWEVTDPAVEAEVVRRLVNRDIDYFEYADYLQSVWGVGLSNDDFQKYRDKSKKDKASPELQSALAVIDGVLSDQIDGATNDSKKAELYVMRANLMTSLTNDYFNEKYADKDLEDRALYLVRNYLISWFPKTSERYPSPPVRGERVPEAAKPFAEARGSSEIPPDYVPPGYKSTEADMTSAYQTAKDSGKLYRDTNTGEYVFQFNGKWYKTTDGVKFEERK